MKKSIVIIGAGIAGLAALIGIADGIEDSLPIVAQDMVALIAQTTQAQLWKDAFVIGHLLAMIVGLGTVLSTDVALLRSIKKPFSAMELMRIERAHKLIAGSLAVLWATGLGLFWLKTGGDITTASPKLIAKLVTVTTLTATAVAMSTALLPMLREALGVRLMHLPLVNKLVMVTLAALSVSSWGTALLLGAAGTTLSAGSAALTQILLLTYLGPLVSLWSAVLVTHLAENVRASGYWGDVHA